MFGTINRIKQYYQETVQEVKRASWPTKLELREQTILVVIVLGILTLFIWVVDTIGLQLVNFLTHH